LLVVTMAIYLGFIHLLGVLLIGSIFSRTCLLLLLLLGERQTLSEDIIITIFIFAYLC
jgi:hypothetical protein